MLLAVVGLGVGVAIAAAKGGGDPRGGGTTSTEGEVSGPCDEAEHANDSGCAGDPRGAGGAGADDDRGRFDDFLPRQFG